jgi:putative membrane protein
MSTEVLLRYLHFISIFTIVGTLVSEHLLLKRQMTRAEVTRLAKIDGVYGLAAIVLLSVGLTLWLGGYGKPADYYSKMIISLSVTHLFR